jgi:hypothetical protein
MKPGPMIFRIFLAGFVSRRIAASTDPVPAGGTRCGICGEPALATSSDELTKAFLSSWIPLKT